MKIILRTMLWLILIIIVLFGGFILFITLSDYKPDKEEIIHQVLNDSEVHELDQDTFGLIAWNIGYAGLGAEMDFFYDGGKGVRPSKELSRKYLNGIKKFLIGEENIDFWLLQEVDESSKRSHRMKETEEIINALPDYFPVFARNYKVPFVPVPIYEPMGPVKGGILSLSRATPSIAIRYAYPLIASWPNRLFLLDRCFILSRYPLKNGKDLVVMNTHNSAYVYDSTLREKELDIILQEMTREYKKGNYVIAGGDWNANPPDFEPVDGFNGHRHEASKVKMRPDFLPDNWTFAYDPGAPTNRNNDKPFVKGENGTTCLDYFMLSPNIKLLEAKTIDLEFQDSDHNPVFVRVKLD
jgi:endonuclease/exonuclease/phosphatase family metal-dependent hydrolase